MADFHNMYTCLMRMHFVMKTFKIISQQGGLGCDKIEFLSKNKFQSKNQKNPKRRRCACYGNATSTQVAQAALSTSCCH